MDEYGGYLPLELSNKNEFFDDKINCVLRTNTGRAAMYYALKNISPKRVFIPHFMCESVYSVASDLCLDLVKYFIDESFAPIGIDPNYDDCIIITNYFGVNNKIIKKLCAQYKYTNILVDNTQAFFSEPIKGVYNIYSPRKFFGVSDGGYLIHENMEMPSITPDISYDKIGHILKCIDLGTNEAYELSLENEAKLNNTYKGMSALTLNILSSIDYESVKNKRFRNFKFLYEEFRDLNELEIDMYNASPFAYPLLFKGNKIKDLLVCNKIYTPTLWRHNLTAEYQGTFEQTMANFCTYIPIDQRYDIEDMETVSKIVRSLLIRQLPTE